MRTVPIEMRIKRRGVTWRTRVSVSNEWSGEGGRHTLVTGFFCGRWWQKPLLRRSSVWFVTHTWNGGA